jgi:hypothetical protein
MTHRINGSGEIEHITTSTGDIWKDGRRWQIAFPKGAYTASKARCQMLQRQMVKDGLITAVGINHG